MIKASLLVLIYLNEALGHGFMYYPTTWVSQNEIIPTNGLKGAQMGFPGYPLPDEVCEGEIGTECSSSAFNWSWPTDWFTNYTRIPGDGLTMSDEMYGTGSEGTPLPNWARKNPWVQPGTAPVHGEGCGVNGGNPTGCQGDSDDSSPFGTCCGGSWKWKEGKKEWKNGCGGYTGGKPAFEHYADGLFGESFTTTWTRGNAESVYWTDMAGHAGGYGYRLCKIPPGGVTHITEECFNQGHLYFVGDTNWLYADMQPWSQHDYSKWEEVPAIRTTEGTYPPGSEWTKVLVRERGWAFKDYVQVPEDIEPGSYILSFRWDCQFIPQIWSNCANIEVV